MTSVRITKRIWIDRMPLDVGATVSLKPRLALDLITIGAAEKIPVCTKKKTKKGKGENGSINEEDSGAVPVG